MAIETELVDASFAVIGSSPSAIVERIHIAVTSADRTVSRPAADTVVIARVIKRFAGRRTALCSIRVISEPRRVVVTVQGEIEHGLIELVRAAAIGAGREGYAEHGVEPGSPSSRSRSSTHVPSTHVPSSPSSPSSSPPQSSFGPIGPPPGTPAPQPTSSASSWAPSPASSARPASPPSAAPPAGGAPVPALDGRWFDQMRASAPSAPRPGPSGAAGTAGPAGPAGSGAHRGMVVALSDGRRMVVRGLTLVGRDPAGRTGELAVDLLALVDPQVSKTHLALTTRDGRLWAEDRGSTNGSVLIDRAGREHPIEPHQPVELQRGAHVRIGSTRLSVE